MCQAGWCRSKGTPSAVECTLVAAARIDCSCSCAGLFSYNHQLHQRGTRKHYRVGQACTASIAVHAISMWPPGSASLADPARAGGARSHTAVNFNQEAAATGSDVRAHIDSYYTRLSTALRCRFRLPEACHSTLCGSAFEKADPPSLTRQSRLP